MANKPSNHKNLKPFKKGQSGNLKGRPPDALNRVMKKLTKEELEDVATFIIKGDCEELEKVLNDKKTSVIKSMFASCVNKVIKTGDMDAMEKVLNRLIGKVKDQIDVTGNGVLPTTVILKIPDNGRATLNESATN